MFIVENVGLGGGERVERRQQYLPVSVAAV